MTLDNESSTSATLDLDAYLRRIDYRGELKPTRSALEALHLAHATHIPFENIDALIRRPILLDLASLQAKLVAAGRGGYCFEQNGLFAAVLRHVGFDVTTLAARVRYRVTQALPRTHMTLLVQAEGEEFLADVGFGASGLLAPVPFGTGEVSYQSHWSYRIIQEEKLWLLQTLQAGVWTDLYAFSLEPQQPADYEMANYYVSTNPASRHVHTLTAQKITPEARYTLRGSEFVVDHGTNVTTRQLSAGDDIPALLAQTFGLRLPDGFPVPSGEPVGAVKRLAGAAPIGFGVKLAFDSHLS
jgi:N-hydroxyarylamine O-acetyltransferase